MEYRFTIDGTLPNLNDYLQAERQVIRTAKSYTTRGNEMKQFWQNHIVLILRGQLKGLKIDKAIFITYRFFEPNKRRDLDNISAFAHKVIQDALVKSGIIKNDGWKEIVGFQDSFYIDKENPRIEVVLREVEDG